MYKYREFNEYAISNLEDGTLYCAVPGSFNDPFDSQIGMDLQSFFEAKYGREIRKVEENMKKFVQLLDGVLSVEELNEQEKELLDSGFAKTELYSLIGKYRNDEITNEEIKEVLTNDIGMILETVELLAPNGEFKTLMGQGSKPILDLLQNISTEGRQRILDEYATYSDFARWFGIEDDADEIALASRMHRSQFPEQAEIADKVDNIFTEAVHKISEGIDKTFRIGCLSSDYNNRLLWSHYADGHKGFCIEYDFNKLSEETGNIVVLPVIYSKERPKFPWEAVLKENKDETSIKNKGVCTFLQSLLTKDEIWRYENEWRVIMVSPNGKENIKMPPISCLYVGANCSIENKKRLVQIAKEHNIPVKEMWVDRGEYSLHVRECNSV